MSPEPDLLPRSTGPCSARDNIRHDVLQDSVSSHAQWVSENADLRSACVRRLLGERDSPGSQACAASIPRVIVQFWHDLARIPSDVAACIQSWSPLVECGFRRVLFDDSRAEAFIARHLGSDHAHAFRRCGHPAMRCDYFRLCYLLERGGFYIDADEWYLGADCDPLLGDDRLRVQPLCYDRAAYAMVPAAVFLSEPQPSEERTFYVNNNPLIAPRGHPVIHLALERATGLLLQPKAPTDVQSTTGPGNLTASLVRYSIEQKDAARLEFGFLADWDSISISKWPLSYRNDERNWRLWKPNQ